MQIKKLIKSLNKHGVPYSIIGGYAVALHGVLRMTVDIDLLTRLTAANLEKLETALHEMGLQSRIPVTAKEVAQFRVEYIEKRNLIAWSFVNPKNPLEVIAVILTHDMNEFESIKKKIEGETISVISLEGLIQLKKEAGRPQDVEDLKHLQWIAKNEK